MEKDDSQGPLLIREVKEKKETKTDKKEKKTRASYPEASSAQGHNLKLVHFKYAFSLNAS
jgi:hypothetical protein